jgi:3-oxoacyl-[acyl-carrier protein] reductase
VLGVAPGIMLKPDMKRYMLNPQNDQDRAGRGAVAEAITQQVQLGRASLPEEPANVVAFLATEAADYLCGQTIDVAGGQWMN